jgi:hypothetical protein
VTPVERLWAWAVLLAGLAHAPSVWCNGNGTGEPAAPAPDPARLIQQLGHQDFRIRQAAGQALAGLGPQALPALQQARDHADLEVRRRVRDLLEPLESAALLAPKRVSLNLTRRPLKDAVAELARQTGYKIDAGHASRDDQVYTFRFADQPFWEAVDRLCAAGGLVVQHGWGDDCLRLQSQEAQTPYVFHNGLFRVVAEGFQHHRGIQFGAVPRNQIVPGQRSEYFSFALSIASEPRLPLLGLGQVRLTAAVDDQNNSLVPSLPNDAGFHGFYGHFGRGLSMQTQVNLDPPSREARSVRLLRGAIPVTLLVEQKPLVVADNILSAKKKKWKAGDTTLEVEEVKHTPEKVYQVKLSLTEPRKDRPNDYTWINSVYQRLELQDAKGNKYQPQGNTWSNTSPTHVQGTFSFGSLGNPQLGPPARLVYYTWVTRQHHVAFEFRDLPLP